jgi:hypothetical protein
MPDRNERGLLTVKTLPVKTLLHPRGAKGWIAATQHEPTPSRPEAIRRLIELGMEAAQSEASNG